MAFKIKDGVQVGTTNVFNNAGTLLVNAPTATKLLTARDLSLTGDATATLSGFDGNANVSAAVTLATVNSNTGSFGSSSAIPVITVNAKGLITAVSTASISTTLNTAGSSGTGSVALSNQTLTISGGTGVTTTATNQSISIAIGQAVNTTSNVTFNDLVVNGNLTVNGTTTTINSTVVSVDDITFELGSVASPTDVTANGGGIVLKGATDKTITWSSVGWTSSEDFNLVTGKQFKINGTNVLSATTLGSSVINSSLTSVGTIGTGTWQGTVIAPTYGGTGVNNGSSTLTLAGNVTHAGAFTQTFTATANTSVTLPSSGILATLAGTETLTNKTLSAPTIRSAYSLANSGGTLYAAVNIDTAIVGSTTATAIDTFSATTFRSAKFIVQITQGSSYQVSEVLVVHNGTTTTMTEYGVLETGSSLGTLSTDISGGNIRLLVTMGSATSSTIVVYRQALYA
jgi:hypothetical protein